jgi:hypothetical protein
MVNVRDERSFRRRPQPQIPIEMSWRLLAGRGTRTGQPVILHRARAIRAKIGVLDFTNRSRPQQMRRGAITAAVVGVILNLAMYFGYHVLWPNGIDAAFDWAAAAIAIAAGVALLLLKRNVMAVIGGCAVAGLVIWTLR